MRRPSGDFKWRLYDIKRDPAETKDISAENPKLVETLQNAYADYVRKNGVIEAPPDYSIDGALKQKHVAQEMTTSVPKPRRRQSRHA